MAVRFTEREARALANKYPHLNEVLFPASVRATHVEPVRSDGVDAKRRKAVVETRQQTAVAVAYIMTAVLWLVGIGFGIVFIAANIVAAPFTFVPALLIAAVLVRKRRR